MDSILNMRRLKELPLTVVLKVAQITAEKLDFKIVVDQHGDSHKLMRTDFFPMEWKNIRVGSEFAVPIRWSINSIRLIPKKLPIEREKEITLMSEDCMWYCKTCGAKGVVNSVSLDNLKRKTREAYEEHKKKSSDCSQFVIKVSWPKGNDMIESESLTKMMAFEISKIS